MYFIFFLKGIFLIILEKIRIDDEDWQIGSILIWELWSTIII